MLMLKNTAYMLSATMFELFAHSQDFQKVKNEFIIIILDKNRVSSYLKVKNLFYFNIYIQEILYLHLNILSCMSYIFFEVNIMYHNKRCNTTYMISSDTFTSMSMYIIHINFDIFKNFYKYYSHRWINNLKLSQFFIAFSQELRNCIK